jgi:hypothetical protein
MWYSLAANAGDKDANKYRADIAEEMTEAELEKN